MTPSRDDEPSGPRSLNILLVNHYALPPSRAGGTRHFALSRELTRRGHEVTIAASNVDYMTRQGRHLGRRENFLDESVEGVRFLWVRSPAYSGNSAARLWNMLSFSGRLLQRAAAPHLGRPDVVLGSSPHPFAALAAQRLAQRFQAPFVLEVRDVWPETLVELAGISPHHPLVRVLGWIEDYLYRHASRIVSVLPGAKDQVAAKGTSSEKVVWIPNGVDLNFVPEPSPCVESPVFTVMYAGAHGLANGLDTVLDAAAILQAQGFGSEIRFALVGDGPEKSRLQARAESEGLDVVKFLAPVPKREVYRVLQGADVFLMILKESPVFRWGVSPNKLFDYLVMARPVIFGVNTPFDMVTEAGAGIRIEPEDAGSLAAAVLKLRRCPIEARREMGERARRYVEENHNLARLAGRLEQVLLKALGATDAR